MEVLVVVVGLLLGLQLNDWAQGRQDRELVGTYYRQLIIDLESDALTGEFAVDYANELDESALVVADMLAGEPLDTLDDGTLMRSIIRAGYSYRPLTNRQTYDELINTGSLGLIRDVSIKRAIGDYYASMQRARQWDALVQHEQTTYRDSVRGILTPEQLRWVRQNLRSVTTPHPPLDRAQLLQDVAARTDIADALSAMAGVQERFRGQGYRKRERAEALIDTLSTALGEAAISSMANRSSIGQSARA